MIFIPLFALVAGFLLVYRFSIPAAWADYAAIAILAGMDALIGAVRARLEGQFDEAVFVSGFFVNMGLAILLSYLGDKMGVDIRTMQKLNYEVDVEKKEPLEVAQQFLKSLKLIK